MDLNYAEENKMDEKELDFQAIFTNWMAHIMDDGHYKCVKMNQKMADILSASIPHLTCTEGATEIS